MYEDVPHHASDGLQHPGFRNINAATATEETIKAAFIVRFPAVRQTWAFLPATASGWRFPKSTAWRAASTRRSGWSRRDDTASPEFAKTVVDELLTKEKVVAVLGVCNTGVGLATIAQFQKAKVPLIVPVSTGTPLTKKFADAPENWIFRVSRRVTRSRRRSSWPMR